MSNRIELAITAAEEITRQTTEPGRAREIVSTIDDLVAFSRRRPDGSRVLRWPEEVCSAAKLRPDHPRWPLADDVK